MAREKTKYGDFLIKYTDLFMLIPAFAYIFVPAFMLSFPVLRVIVRTVTSSRFELNSQTSFYHMSVKAVVLLSVIFGIFSVVLYFVREKHQKHTIRLSDFIPCIFFAFFCVWMILSTCVNGFTDYALNGQEYRDESLFSFLAYFGIFWFCSYLVKSEKLKMYLLRFFMVSGFLVNTVTLLYTFFSGKCMNPAEYDDFSGLNMIFTHFNHYGYYLILTVTVSAALIVFENENLYKVFSAISLSVGAFALILNRTLGCFIAAVLSLLILCIISVKNGKKRFVPALIATGIFVLVTNIVGAIYGSFYAEIFDIFRGIFKSTKTALILISGILAFAAVIICLFIIYQKNRKLFYALLALLLTVLIVFAFFIFSNERYSEFVDSLEQYDAEIGAIARKEIAMVGNGRGTLWLHTIKYIFEKPLFGFGVEGISERLNTETIGISDRTHDEFLQYAAFFGIPALIMYLCGIFSCIFKCGKEKIKRNDAETICLLLAFCYLISSMFGNTMFYTAAFFPIFLGLSNVRNNGAVSSISETALN